MLRSCKNDSANRRVKWYINYRKKLDIGAIYFDAEIVKVFLQMYLLIDLKEANAETVFTDIKKCLEEDEILIVNVINDW